MATPPLTEGDDALERHHSRAGRGVFERRRGLGRRGTTWGCAERKEDAERRQELATKFTSALSDVILTQKESLKEVVGSQKEEVRYMQDQHDKSQEKDRAAFDVRTESIKMAIEKQTDDLKTVIKAAGNHPNV